MGLLQTDVKHYYLQTRMAVAREVSTDRASTRSFFSSKERARREAVQEGFDPKAIRRNANSICRYPSKL